MKGTFCAEHLRLGRLSVGKSVNRKGVRLAVSRTPCAVVVVGIYFTSSNLTIFEYQCFSVA